MRGTVPADKLSDGERTAIAFAYFVTSLEGDGENIANTIVYIDDPISSLDSNHVYAVYALIQERLETSLQLLVSTHNSEFFNLLKSRWLKDTALRTESEAFYVRRLADVNGSYAQLESLPTQLRKFGSE
jgi:wobble nucleotide-excising tRNase